ncbi:MAG TPA: pilus assembly PilX N-terminal domain-containing protein [Candidatus Fimivivens sp.]|nr:pilus assembly PilX N-terminal domain-containing protein [Candidatus Fimivivens sp.]
MTAKGSALAFALVILLATSIILTSILGFISSQIKRATYEASREQAFQVAEQGIQFYKWYLAHQTDGRTAQQIDAFWTSGSAYGVGSDYVANVSDPGGGIMGSYRLTVTPPIAGSTIVIVKSVGRMIRYPDVTRTIQVRFRRPSWSESAVMSNDFMRFGEDTEVYGKIQSNLGIRFDGLAHNVVSSVVPTTDDPDHSGNSEFGVHTHVNIPPSSGVNDNFRSLEAPPSTMQARTDVFVAGRKFPIASTDFNGVLGNLSYMKTQAQSGQGRYFGSVSNSGSTYSSRRIILKTNGTYDTCLVRSYSTATNDIGSNGYAKPDGSGSCGSCSGQCLQNFPILQNGVIFVEGNVWLSGQVNGRKVTIVGANLTGMGSSMSVYIPNDLLYTNYDGTDIIGVIGQQDVDIPLTSDTDLRIDGALLAQQGRVGRSNYGSSDHKHSITLFGAMATNHRYGFAWTNPFTDWGYDIRNLYYDNNLLYYPPPFFPTGTQYLVDLWEER